MIPIWAQRSDFYNELSHEKQKLYFGIKSKNFLPAIDNIYYSVFLEDDCNENQKLFRFFRDLDNLKNLVASSHEPQEFINGLMLDGKSFDLYKYCLSAPDLYDIFILGYLPNRDTPRVLVQIRAYGLWNFGAEKMLSDSFNHVSSVFQSLGCSPVHCRENRIDYCYHTNALVNPEKIFSDRNINNHMSTTLRRWHQTGRIDSSGEGLVLRKDYFALGERRSNNVFVRCYNKALEVVEGGYKGFFFEIWYKNGLISFYDKYCLERAFEHKDYVHKAKLEFYLEHGIDDNVKREFDLALKDTNMTLSGYKELANSYMPPLTTVMNIEYETKRKFYYYSDEFIDHMLKFQVRSEAPQALKRIYKIIDNRFIFLEYLTRETLCFKASADKYVWWWDRLRNTKLDGLKIDEKLIRDYSHKLDERLLRNRFIASVASNAVYADSIESDFREDIADLLSNINDNDINNYFGKKLAKEKRLRNRKKMSKPQKVRQKND